MTKVAQNFLLYTTGSTLLFKIIFSCGNGPLSFNFSVKNFIFSHTLICVHLWTRDSQFVMYLLFCFHFLAHNKIRHQTAEEKCFFRCKHQTYGINKLDWMFSFILVPVFPLRGCFEFIFHLLPYFPYTGWSSGFFISDFYRYLGYPKRFFDAIFLS